MQIKMAISFWCISTYVLLKEQIILKWLFEDLGVFFFTIFIHNNALTVI